VGVGGRKRFLRRNYKGRTSGNEIRLRNAQENLGPEKLKNLGGGNWVLIKKGEHVIRAGPQQEGKKWKAPERRQTLGTKTYALKAPY